jgi:hypothetical protein
VRRPRLVALVPLGVTAVLLCGCTYLAEQKAHEIEPMLSAAGFRMKIADTPERLARIQAMRQLTLQPLQRNGKLYYAYPDARGCRCVYLGTEAAYQQYQQLALQERIARQEQQSAVVDEDAAIINEDAVWDQWGMDVW